MSCYEFAKVVEELASGRQRRDAAHDEGLEHAAMCSRCAARLEVERSLSTGLSALAVEERSIEASALVKRDLLDAFASHRQKASQTVVSFPRRQSYTRRWLAAAATLLLAFTLLALRAVRNNAPAASGEDVIASAASLNFPEIKTVKTVTPTPPVVIQKTEALKPKVNLVAAVSRSKRKFERKLNPVKPENTASEFATEVASNEAKEIKSDFVPLTYLNTATAMESGIVVRVEVAREKLAALGLPLNLERAGETIKADIVVGDDGVARAIRLVQ
ncbi:MAG: hypothetical protein JOZ52_11245 [Acidobacteria bacterium]|nr:hypothetical protein [Acidobacteriota bacterium]